MDLYINQQKIDIELQEEKNAGEVMAAMTRWLRQNGFSVLEIKLNGAICSLTDNAWQNTPLESIITLEIDAPLRRELRVANLEILLEYLLQVQDLVAGIDKGTHTPLDFDAYAANIREIMPSGVYLSSDPSNAKSSLEDNLLKSVEAGIRQAAESAHTRRFKVPEEFPGHLGHLVLMCQERIQEALQPESEAKNTCLVLKSSLEDLTMVSTKFMMGDTKGAFDAILRFSELLSKLLRLYWILLEEVSPGEQAGFTREELESLTQKTNATLEQIGTAIEDEDPVLLGDLLEYELPDQIQALTALLEK